MGHIHISNQEEESKYFNIDLMKRKEILDLFTGNHVLAYLTGHPHKLTRNEYVGIQQVSCETTNKNFVKRPFGFRLREVMPYSISHSFIHLEQ